MSSKVIPHISFIVPIYGRHADISSLIDRASSLASGQARAIELVFVYEHLEHREISNLVRKHLALASSKLSIVQVSLRKSFGQHPSSVIGLHHAAGEYLTLIDSDDSYLIWSLSDRVSIFSNLDLDFEMYQPVVKASLRPRGLGTSVANQLGRTWTRAPKDFRFSSKVLMTATFFESVKLNLQTIGDMQSGWMFHFSSRYRGQQIAQAASDTPNRSTYSANVLTNEMLTLIHRVLRKYQGGAFGIAIVGFAFSAIYLGALALIASVDFGLAGSITHWAWGAALISTSGLSAMISLLAGQNLAQPLLPIRFQSVIASVTSRAGER